MSDTPKPSNHEQSATNTNNAASLISPSPCNAATTTHSHVHARPEPVVSDASSLDVSFVKLESTFVTTAGGSNDPIDLCSSHDEEDDNQDSSIRDDSSYQDSSDSDEHQDDESFWACKRNGCNCKNLTGRYKCSKCHGWRDGKKPTKKKWQKLQTQHDNDESYWICERNGCKYKNPIAFTRCSKCQGWRDGKKPIKQKRQGQIEHHGNKKQKKSCNGGRDPSRSFDTGGLKPFFQKGDKVYAAAMQNNKLMWFLGEVVEHEEVRSGGKYGPTRQYRIQFDDSCLGICWVDEEVSIHYFTM